MEVRVLIDDIGSHYTRPTMVSVLSESGVPTETFMHSLMPAYVAYFNLRSHRKILVVDGKVGFTGGMNIRRDAGSSSTARSSPRTCTFDVDGPVVAQLQEVFAEDWAFTTPKCCRREAWYPPLSSAGGMLAAASATDRTKIWG